jgi:hypothetical protein
VRQLAAQLPLPADVVHDQHGACNLAGGVANRRRGILDRNLVAVTRHEHRVLAHLGDPALTQTHVGRVLERVALDVMAQHHDLADGASARLFE